MMGDYDRAKQDLEKAITLNPSAAFPIVARGRMYRLKGEIELAPADLDRAVILSPQYSFALMERGDTYQAKGHYDRASPTTTACWRSSPITAPAQQREAAPALRQAGPARIEPDAGTPRHAVGRPGSRRRKSPTHGLRRSGDGRRQAFHAWPRRCSATAISTAASGALDRLVANRRQQPQGLSIPRPGITRKGDLERAAAEFDRAIALNRELRRRLHPALRDADRPGQARPGRGRRRASRAHCRQRSAQLQRARPGAHAAGPHEQALDDFDHAITINPASTATSTRTARSPTGRWAHRQGLGRPVPRASVNPKSARAMTIPRRDLHRRAARSTAPSPSSSRQPAIDPNYKPAQLGLQSALVTKSMSQIDKTG